MNEQKIWEYLTGHGLTPQGTAGLMGNLFAESGLISNRVEILCLQRLREHGKFYTDSTYTAFVDDGTISRAEFINPLPNRVYGYGYAQWTTPDRKGKLYDRAKKEQVSIGDSEMQLAFLIDELRNDFPACWQVVSSTDSVLDATEIILRRFECPADCGPAVLNQRLKYAMNYYNQFKAGDTVTADTIIGIYRGWLGWSEQNGKYRQIIDIYNSHKPLARGYKVQYSDPWCDATVSAAFITAGDVSIIGGTECGVYDHVLLFKKAGIWRGKQKPIAGDIIVFDWQQDGVGDHIGVVEKIEGDTVTTLEGNYQDSVARRVIGWNDRTILGYARPKYGTDSKDVTASQSADKFDAKIAGTYEAKSKANMRDGASSSKFDVIGTFAAGQKFQCYGYYSLNGTAKWLYVQTVKDKIKYTGFISSGLLKKI